MESSQLKRLSIVGISILCLSSLEIFSNKLFENRKANNENTVILATADMKLKANYLSNNYEIFNPNIKTASENLETLASQNKKNEISDNIENNIESENKSENIKEEKQEETKEETKEVVKQQEEKVTKKDSVSTKKEEIVTTKEEKTTTKIVTEKKVEQPKKTETVKQESTVLPPNTETATSLVNYAKQFVGNPYKSGGTSLTNGADCSGFTMKIYENFGYSLPHSSRSQANYGSYVSINNLQPGDLIFYGYNGSISHVAIYIGNSQIVHASTNTGGIKIANYKIMPIITARRILSNS